ncbi:hypothetical protein [Novacetimonas cocois]|uniref:hypothetical protein n=1 Tax=Novacetimonas cocois TaxID=1747507 RepID=UPI00197E1733|nr:hypothetical protein [Novacetimonas cocois]
MYGKTPFSSHDMTWKILIHAMISGMTLRLFTGALLDQPERCQIATWPHVGTCMSGLQRYAKEMPSGEWSAACHNAFLEWKNRHAWR